MLDLDWLTLVSGVGIFLWGMSMVEASLTKLASGKLHYFIGKWTDTTISAVITGAVCTALIQSSSLLTLIVLALASSKLLDLKQAVGLIFGANLGTTATGWLVALLGFKVSLGDIAIYIIGISALARLFFRNKHQYTLTLSLIISIGLILFSLDLIKSSTLGISETITINEITSPVIFFFTGMILAVLFQSSSAVMIMTLSAANAGIINLESSVAIVIGADLGTTSTAALGSINGAKIKKQLAFAHFSFNLVMAAIGLLILLPQFINTLNWLGWHDPLLPIVAFHSINNCLGILIFTPLINSFVRFISKRFSDQANNVETKFSLIQVTAPAVALQQLQHEAHHFLLSVARFNYQCLKNTPNRIKEYLELKQTEGIFIDTCRRLSKQAINEQQSNDIYCLLSAIRDGTYSAKALKDIVPDLDMFNVQEQLDKTGNVPLYQLSKDFYQQQQTQLVHRQDLTQDSTETMEEFYHTFKSTQENLFNSEVSRDLPIEQVSTLLNINKQLFTSSKYFISALNNTNLKVKESSSEN